MTPIVPSRFGDPYSSSVQLAELGGSLTADLGALEADVRWLRKAGLVDIRYPPSSISRNRRQIADAWQNTFLITCAKRLAGAVGGAQAH
jgi:hypothetical protein